MKKKNRDDEVDEIEEEETSMKRRTKYEINDCFKAV